MSRIAINGLGRIGRLILRSFVMNPPSGLELAAANDLTSREDLAYLIKYDSVYRNAPFSVSVTDSHLDVGGHRVAVSNEKDPARLPWKDLGIEVVLECTGRFRKRADSARHLEAGASRVIISAPSDDADITLVMGVNEKEYDPEKHQVISNASCTTNSLAPAVKVLNDAFGVEYLMVTTVHAYTSSQTLVDLPARKRRRGRAAAVSLVPTTTGAARATALTIPELKGRMDAIAIRAPVVDGSITDMVAFLRKDISVETVNEAFRKAAGGELKGILEYTEEEIVSSDIIGNAHSGIVDASSTKVIDNRVAKVLVWYDNEYAYARRMLDISAFILGKTREVAGARHS